MVEKLKGTIGLLIVYSVVADGRCDSGSIPLLPTKIKRIGNNK